MTFKAVIFDLDGTLLDTLADIADSANRVLANRGFPTHHREAYKHFVGDGSKRLMTRALPEDTRQSNIVDACLNDFIDDYNAHWACATRPYDGIIELLTALQNHAFKMAVVTNKPHRFTKVMMDHFFRDIPFFPVLGQQDGIPKKPHPQQAVAATSQMDVAPASCLFLGDSAVDMETARRGGMQPVGANWGFRTARELRASGAMAVIDRPTDLLHLF